MSGKCKLESYFLLRINKGGVFWERIYLFESCFGILIWDMSFVEVGVVF